MKKIYVCLIAISCFASYVHGIHATNDTIKENAMQAQNESLISLNTRDLNFVFRVDKKKKLNLQSIGSSDGQWVSPLSGPIFPTTPHPEENGPRYISPLSVITADGSSGLELFYQSHTYTKPKSGVEHLTISLCDSIHPIQVELHMRTYFETNIVEQWLVLKNGMKSVIKVSRLDSLYFRANANKGIHLEWFESNQDNTAAFPINEKLSLGVRLLESRDGNRHKSGPVPAIILGFGAAPEETNIPCLIACLEWIGSSRFSFEVNNKEELEVSIGINQYQPFVLEAGLTLESPHSICGFSKSGTGTASRNLHRWVRSEVLPGGDRLRLIDNNSWEGCGMNVSEKNIIEMMKQSADLGIELYVLDDGWFGNGQEARLKDNAGLGDWQFNSDRFPNKLDKIMDVSKELGIRFGIWFEPEMVNKRSKLYQNKPGWVMQNPGREIALQRNQAVLDVANPEVQQHMYNAVNDVLKAYPDIKFVKWDCNANINNPYSPYLGADRQGCLLGAYSAGYLTVMKRLIEQHPNVDIQACSAGGGRSNYSALRYGHTFWPSDCTEPMYRLNAQWNFSKFLPQMTMTSHVTVAGGTGIPVKFRFDVSMMGQLGLEVDTGKCTPQYLAACRTGIAAYKRIRDIVQLGELYRHSCPTKSNTPSMNYVSLDKKRAFILAYQTNPISEAINFNAPVSGLEPERVYKLVEMNLPEGDAQARLASGINMSQTGTEWMKSGVPLKFTRALDSAAILLE